MSLSTEQSEQLVALMSEMGSPVPENVFRALHKYWYVNAVELALVFESLTGPELLMTKREEKDPFYPGMWHMPGSIQRQGETFVETAARCLESEVGPQFEHLAERATYIGHWNDLDRVRGHINQFLYLVQLERTDMALFENEDCFFSLVGLPRPIIRSHITMAKRVYEHYAQRA